MPKSGFILIHRKVFENEFCKDNFLKTAFWIYLIQKATHQDYDNKGVHLKRGQLIVGTRALKKQTKIPSVTAWRWLKKMEKLEMIKLEPTNMYTVVSILKYDQYQNIDKVKRQMKRQTAKTETPKTSKKATNTTQKQDHAKKVKRHTQKNETPTENIQRTSNKEQYTKNKTSTTGAGNEINEFLDLFADINPTYERLFGNTTQRNAMQRLITKFGADKIKNTIAILQKTNNQMYAPTIMTPLELERDLGKLIAFHKKQKDIIKTKRPIL